MSIKTVTVKYIVCDRCRSSEDGKGEFTEYPEGAGRFLGHRVDLCDRCVLEGFVVFRGRVMQESEIDHDAL